MGIHGGKLRVQIGKNALNSYSSDFICLPSNCLHLVGNTPWKSPSVDNVLLGEDGGMSCEIIV